MGQLRIKVGRIVSSPRNAFLFHKTHFSREIAYSGSQT
jgi:hypothetical protein